MKKVIEDLIVDLDEELTRVKGIIEQFSAVVEVLTGRKNTLEEVLEGIELLEGISKYKKKNDLSHRRPRKETGIPKEAVLECSECEQ